MSAPEPPGEPGADRLDAPAAGSHQPPQPPGRTGRAVTAALLLVAGVVALLGVRVLGSAQQPSPPTAAAAPAATTAPPAPTTAAPPAAPVGGEGVYGNLVPNWSFEESLDGWQVVGPADVTSAPPGRTSGSSAYVRPRGAATAQVGLALPAVVRSAPRGSRYVATAWVRSTSPGLPVTLRLGPTGGGARTVATTMPGVSWRRLTVAYVAAAGGSVELAVTAPVPPGDGLQIDEVTVRRG